jgi:hypothetical protein
MSMSASHGPSSKLRRKLGAVVAAAGALLAAPGCTGGYDIPAPPEGTPALQGDADCDADSEPSQGDACTRDCLMATCASGTGRRVCTCEGGVFLQCACLPPETWPFRDVPAAPYCDRISGQPRYLSGESCKLEEQQCVSRKFPEQGCTCKLGVWQCGNSEGFPAGAAECEAFGSGLNAVLDEGPCDEEWQLCVSRDYNPTGTSPRGCVCKMDGGRLTWQCGPTNRWWRAE